MSSAGHVFDMIRRIRGNKEGLTSNKAGFRDNIEIRDKRRTFLRFKKVSEPELKSIKNKIRYKAKLEKRRIFLITIVVTIVFVLAYVWVLFF
ncbi:hypothetical protein L3049_10195 [Labilibaculum sp. DW002]|uniref:Riboflavin synthase subunit beta n=1 Tax=Paralabilibaculum antarcticum TaxID=2912572 RepID=A0ABT5VSZ3_9BACT|nr:hypothetical protein [Labilibaculum sp. DW002]MDE5418380.1 hypothetical protein [Labilibaculum sp. DW002]